MQEHLEYSESISNNNDIITNKISSNDTVGSISPSSVSDNTGIVTLTYRCPYVDRLKSQQMRSDVTKTRSMLWRLMVTTKLNRKSLYGDNESSLIDNVSLSEDSARHLSIYVQCDPTKESKFWHCYAKCRLTIVSRNPAKSISKEFRNNFTKKDNDYGYSEFLPFSCLMDPSNEFLAPLEDEEGFYITIIANIVTEYPYGVDWDSRGNTDHVGLLNLGATCYMNSLLQTFYFTNQLRLATYNTPTYLDDGSNSIMYALQYIFYQLQFNNSAVNTTRLTQAFGWTQADSFQQHDVQEFCRILLESMENSMKGTAAENIIAKLLEGKQMSYIKCLNVDYQSERIESVYDIQLKVKGLRNVYDSFDDYVQIEKLDGENKYAAEGYGYQDANKGVIFTHFPPVLHLHLMRFTFDMELLDFIKIRDRYEFPDELNLDRYLHKDHVNPDDPATYTLGAVLVHIGGINSGHYVVYINPDCSGEWLKFDDDLVVKVNKNEAVDDNFGGTGLKVFKPGTTAYMLVYVRNSAKDHVFKSIDCDDIPVDLVGRITRDIAKERFEAFKNEHKKDVITFHVYLEDSFFVCQPLGLVEISKNHGYHFEFFPSYTFEQTLFYVCSQLKVHPDFCKVWLFPEEPVNNTPGLPKLFSREHYSTVLSDLTGFSKKISIFLDTTTITCDSSSPFQHYLPPTPFSSSERLTGETRQPIIVSKSESAEEGVALIFIKFFDVLSSQLSYIGHIYVNPLYTWNFYLDSILKRCEIDIGSENIVCDVDNGMCASGNNHDLHSSSISLYIEDINDIPILIIDRDTFIGNYVTNDQSCILCVQPNLRISPTSRPLSVYDVADFPQFVHKLNNNFDVKFVDEKSPFSADRTFTVNCPPNSNYSDLMTMITARVVHPPEQIQLQYYPSNFSDSQHQSPNAQILTPTNPLTVFDIAKKSRSFMMSPRNSAERVCTIFYECLDINVSQLVENVRFHLKFIPDIKPFETVNDNLINDIPQRKFTSSFYLPLLLPKCSTVKQLVYCANQYLHSIDYPLVNSVRILEVVSSKIVCILSDEISVSRIVPAIEKTLIVEEIPSNQLQLSFEPYSNDRLINCCFCHNKGMSYNDIMEQVKFQLRYYPSEILNECCFFLSDLDEFLPFPQHDDVVNMNGEFPFDEIFLKNIKFYEEDHGDDAYFRVFSSNVIICINMNTTDTYNAPARNNAVLKIAK